MSESEHFLTCLRAIFISFLVNFLLTCYIAISVWISEVPISARIEFLFRWHVIRFRLTIDIYIWQCLEKLPAMGGWHTVWSVCGAGAGHCWSIIVLISVPRKFEGDPGRIHSWIPVTALSRITEGVLRSVRSHGTGGRGDKSEHWIWATCAWIPGTAELALPFGMPRDLSVVNTYLLRGRLTLKVAWPILSKVCGLPTPWQSVTQPIRWKEHGRLGYLGAVVSFWGRFPPPALYL